ncbi:flagellin [Massilia sp. TS11]|uniref:flagellin N-terminal helical domain-containing protein n=1 Tax=Massilia sp. TS11 TaxID=2908003 RepID=UPI0027D93CFA|nr:flagellin [Massilia sp. TS11]
MQTITTNLPSLNVQTLSERSRILLESSTQRLATGLRITSAKDDAAGFAISERMSAGVTGLNRATRNTNDAVSLLQTAEGAVATLVDNFQRIRELAVQAANGSYSKHDRDAMQAEAAALVLTNQHIVSTTRFNGNVLLDGSFSEQIQVGANAGDQIHVEIPELLKRSVDQLGLQTVPVTRVTATSTVSGALTAGALSLNGQAVGASVAGAGLGRSANSAFAVAAAINAAAITGISASASTSLSVVAANGANVASGGLVINGVAIGAISGATSAQVAASAASAITAAAGSSGVTAVANGNSVALTAADGSDIIIGEGSAGAAAALGFTLGTTRGHLTVTGPDTAGSSTLAVGGSNPGAAGLSSGIINGSPTGATTTALLPVGVDGEAAIDLTTAAGAAAAIDYMDTKIDRTNQIRAQLGANQRRLELVINRSMGAAAELDAARSRIRDADFAQETAQLTRAQILQQAAMAVMTQANTQPRQALVLLR